MEPISHPAPRQTQSYLRELFQAYRLHPKNKLGQNFLIDLNLIDFLVRSAELTRDDLAVEIGSGTGSLTAKLADLAGAVLSVEIDPAFHELACETVHGHANVRLLNADVLKNKNLLNPEVLTNLEEMCQQFQPKRMKLVANLPYAVATPVISNFLIAGVDFERMIVTVQWEIAEKMIAQPSTKEYGALAVLVQSLADTEVLRKLAPSVFWPKPQVDSGIVKIVPNAAKRKLIPDVPRFRNFLRDLYSHRRKNLRGGIISMTGHQHEKAIVDANSPRSATRAPSGRRRCRCAARAVVRGVSAADRLAARSGASRLASRNRGDIPRTIGSTSSRTITRGVTNTNKCWFAPVEVPHERAAIGHVEGFRRLGNSLDPLVVGRGVLDVDTQPHGTAVRRHYRLHLATPATDDFLGIRQDPDRVFGRRGRSSLVSARVTFVTSTVIRRTKFRHRDFLLFALEGICWPL